MVQTTEADIVCPAVAAEDPLALFNKMIFQGEDFFIETQNVAPPDSRIELISAVNADWNALQSSLLKLRLSSGG